MELVKITKKVIAPTESKDNKEHTFYNIYLFGVAVRCVNQKDFSRLYTSCKTYLSFNGEK